MTSKATRQRALGLAVALASILVPPVAAPAGAQDAEPQAQAERIVDGVRGDWGVYAYSVDTGRPLIDVDADRLMIPASNNKVFTAAWALDVLGPEHRFDTDLLITGPVEDGVLRGDVVLRGSGDPAFGYPDYEEDALAPLRAMARQLRARGVRAVQGDVVGDPTVFDTVGVGPAWPRDTGGGSADYAPRASGLAFQRNVVWVEAEPNPQGGPPLVALTPPVAEVPVVSEARTGGGRAWAVRMAHEDTIRVRGAVGGSGSHRYRVGVAQPALLAAGALRYALEQEGIQVRGRARIGATPPGAALVHRHVSIPVRQMVRELNQASDNFFAEQIWKATVAATVGQGSYAHGGPVSALHFIRRAGVPAGQMYQADGSGLSAHNRASARALVRALVYAHRQPWSELFHHSLAVAAEPGGTMRRLFRNTPAAGNLHAKTGYIHRVRTLSGYVRAANGELIAFSFLYNGPNTFGARSAQEELGVLLARYGGPTAMESS